MTPDPAPKKRRRRQISSQRALAMLRLLPIQRAAVPRIHVSPRQPDGTLRVHDRPTGQELVIYTPRFNRQFQSGHRAGRWYVRPAAHVGSDPQSPSFSTARTALQAVTTGHWSLDSVLASRAASALRVRWPRAHGVHPPGLS